MSYFVLLFLPIFSFNGSLAHNAIKSSLSNELFFFLMSSCIFLCPKYIFFSFIFYANNTLTRAHLTLLGTLKVSSIYESTVLRIIDHTLII